MKRASSWTMMEEVLDDYEEDVRRRGLSVPAGRGFACAHISRHQRRFLMFFSTSAYSWKSALAALLGDGELGPVGRVVAREHVDRRVERRDDCLPLTFVKRR